MPIKVLGLRRTQVEDIGPLRGLPLEQLALDECDKLRDLSPLADCTRLESLSVPRSATNLECLHRLTNLRHLDYASPSDGNWDRIITVDEFWDKVPAEKSATGGMNWTRLFDSKTLSGWTAPDASDWRVDNDGSVVVEGARSHLFSPKTYSNLELKAEIKLAPDANGALAIRATRSSGVPASYMAQANLDPAHPWTGSLFKLTRPGGRFKQETPFRNPEQLVSANTWFAEQIIAVGNRVVVTVNGRLVLDYVDKESSMLSGHIVLKQWHPGAAVRYRNVMVKPLPDDADAAWNQAHKDLPDLNL